MKVTTLIPEETIKLVKHYSNGKNITDSLRIALSEWLEIQKIKELNKKVASNKTKLEFIDAATIREVNRK